MRKRVVMLRPLSIWLWLCNTGEPRRFVMQRFASKLLQLL